MKERKRTDYVVIHCAATKPSMDIGFTEIDQWHKRRGWLGCGYHMIIRRDGTIENGRAMNECGAHVKAFNHNSFGICLVGGMDEDGDAEANFTQKQWDTLDSLVDVMTKIYPNAAVVGHNDLDPNKSCPVFEVSEWMSQIKEIRTS